MPTFVEINQVGRGVLLDLNPYVLTPGTSELITTAGSGSWTKPAGVITVDVELWGAGGAGGGCNTNNTAGAGGAGGQYVKKTLTYSAAEQIIPYIIAATTTGGTGNGTTGQDTTWNTTEAVAKGGQGGSGNLTTVTGNGLGSITGGVGDVVFKGGDGAPPATVTSSGGGGSGAGSTSDGSPASSTTGGTATTEFGGTGGNGVTTSAVGGAGSVYGGGGGGSTKTTGANRAGGNGAQGLIRVTPYTTKVFYGNPIE